MRGLTRSAFALACVGALALAACSSNSGEPTNHTCQTSFDYESAGGASVQSPSTGVLTFDGSFFSNESVLLGYTDNDGAHHQSVLTPPSNSGALTFTGLPSGTRTFTVTVSCDAGQEQYNNGNFTVK